MKPIVRSLVALSATLAVSLPVLAAESGSMRCKGGIVSVGDSAGEVRSKCGEPATATQSEKKVVDRGQGYQVKTVTTITVDNWIFNFGPSEFQYQLELQNGRVARIESLDYGY